MTYIRKKAELCANLDGGHFEHLVHKVNAEAFYCTLNKNLKKKMCLLISKVKLCCSNTESLKAKKMAMKKGNIQITVGLKEIKTPTRGLLFSETTTCLYETKEL